MLCFKFRFKIAISKFVILFVKKDSLLFYLNSLIDFLIMFFCYIRSSLKAAK